MKREAQVGGPVQKKTNINACSQPIQDCYHGLSSALEGYDPCLVQSQCLEASSACEILDLILPCQNILVMCSGLSSVTTSNLLCGRPSMAQVSVVEAADSNHPEDRRRGPVNPEGQIAPSSVSGERKDETTTTTRKTTTVRQKPLEEERLPHGPTTADHGHSGKEMDKEGPVEGSGPERETPRVEGSTDDEWTQALSTREIILVAVTCVFITLIGLCVCCLGCFGIQRRVDRQMMSLPSAFSTRKPRRKGYFRTLYNGMAEGRQQAQLVKKLRVIDRLLKNPGHVDFLFRNHKTLLTSIETSLWRNKFPPGLLATSGMGLNSPSQEDTPMKTVKEWSTEHRPTLAEHDKLTNPSTEALHSSTPSSSSKGRSKLEETSASTIHRTEEGGEDDIRYAPDDE